MQLLRGTPAAGGIEIAGINHGSTPNQPVTLKGKLFLRSSQKLTDTLS